MEGLLRMKSYWFVYTVGSKRFEWIGQDDNGTRSTILQLNKNVQNFGEDRGITMLINGGYELHIQPTTPVTWDDYNK